MRKKRKWFTLTEREASYFTLFFKRYYTDSALGTTWAQAARFAAYWGTAFLREKTRRRLLQRGRRVPRAVVRALAGVARPPRGSCAVLPQAPRAKQMTIWEGLG